MKKDEGKDRSGLVVWVGVAGLLFSAVSTLLVWRTLSDTNKNFIADKRPWIGVSPPATDEGITRMITLPHPGETEASWRVIWKNFGSSPASSVRVRSRVISTNKDGAPMNLEDVNWNWVSSVLETLEPPTSNSEITIMPGQESPQGDRSGHRIDQPEVERIQQQEEFLIFVGVVTYQDTLEHRQHETQTCVVYVAPKNGLPAGWEYCPITLKAT